MMFVMWITYLYELQQTKRLESSPPLKPSGFDTAIEQDNTSSNVIQQLEEIDENPVAEEPSISIYNTSGYQKNWNRAL